MKKMLTIVFMILSTAMLAFPTRGGVPIEANPGCIVMPEVIEACEQGGGRFDYKLCSCVGGANNR